MDLLCLLPLDLLYFKVGVNPLLRFPRCLKVSQGSQTQSSSCTGHRGVLCCLAELWLLRPIYDGRRITKWRGVLSQRLCRAAGHTFQSTHVWLEGH